MNAPALAQQFTHLVHPDRSYRLSYLLRQIAYKTGKIQRHKADKQKKKQRANRQYMRQDSFIFRKVTTSVRPPPVELLALLG